MGADTLPSLDAIATAWRAEEYAAQAKSDALVEKLATAEAPPPAPADPKAAQDAERTAQLEAAAAAALPMLCAVVWRLADRAIQSAAGPHCAATPEELEQLAQLTVPVLDKYLPGGLSAVLKTPEGVLLGTAAIIYGVKVISGAPASPTAAPPPAPAAPEATA